MCSGSPIFIASLRPPKQEPGKAGDPANSSLESQREGAATDSTVN